VYNDNQNNDPITISWTPYVETWAEGSADGVDGEMGQEPEYQPMIRPFTGTPDICGPPNEDPTLFVTLSWNPEVSGNMYDITNLSLEAGGSKLRVEIDLNGGDPILAGDLIRFSGTSTRQRIDGTAAELKEWEVESATASSFIVHINENLNTSLLILDPSVGQVEVLGGDTKSWAGCTWTNGETKEVYATNYFQYAGGSSYTELWLRNTGTNSAADVLKMNRRFFGTTGLAIAEGRAYLGLRPTGSIGKGDLFVNYFSLTSTFNYAYLGILSIGDVGQGANDYLLNHKQKNNSFTDANNVTYSWTEGNGW
jgi:hypothetical protein